MAELRNLVVLLVIGGLIVGATLGWRTLNPPPAADYEIVYFGSDTCGACQVWKRRDLVAWRRDPAAASARLSLAEVRRGGPGAFQGGYGRHHEVFMEAFGRKGHVRWPSFVLLNHGEVVRVKSGLNGWAPIADAVRREHKRRQG